MSELFYNRDNNVSGIASLGSAYSPDYGSSVSFFTKGNSYETQDNYLNYIPHSPNNLIARMNLRYTLNTSEAQEMVVFFENLSGRNPFEFSDGTSIYKDQSGYLESYSLKPVNVNVYNMDASIVVTDNSSLFNWSGKAFVDEDGPAWNFVPPAPVPPDLTTKFQVIYFESGANKFNNFYYAVLDGAPMNGILNNPANRPEYWSNEFSIFQPDIISDMSVSPDITEINFKNSYLERVKAKNNIHAIKTIKLQYKNRTDQECRALLHFLEGKAGYRRFEYTIPQIFNRPKVFYSPSWQHVWNYKDSNDITVELIEDPLGVIPDETSVI